MNCYVLHFGKTQEDRIYVDSFINDKVVGFGFDGNEYTVRRELRLEEVLDTPLGIRHFWGIFETRYDDLQDYLKFAWYLNSKIIYSRARDNLAQYVFNKRAFKNQKRIELLKFIVENYSHRSDGFSAVEVISGLRSYRIFDHPEYETQSNKIKRLMGFLAETGDLRFENGRYTVTGSGVKTVNDADEADRRISSGNRIQLLIFILSLITALAALVEAGLIKLPVIYEYEPTSSTSQS